MANPSSNKTAPEHDSKQQISIKGLTPEEFADGPVEPIGRSNLTIEQKFARKHEGLDSLPGHVLVLFQKLQGGSAELVKLIRPGERFQRIKLPFWDSSSRYFTIAVSQSSLDYSFDWPAKLDDDRHEFILKFHLQYRATSAETVAELLDQDPLRRVRNEIGGVVSRSFAQRKWEAVSDRFREIEPVILNSERDRLRSYASTCGIEIISIEVDRYLPEAIDTALVRAEIDARNYDIETDGTRAKERDARDRTYERQSLEVDHKYALQEEELDRQLAIDNKVDAPHTANQKRMLRERQNDAIGTALQNVGRGITTPDELLAGYEVGLQIIAKTHSGQAPTGPGAPDFRLRMLKLVGIWTAALDYRIVRLAERSGWLGSLDEKDVKCYLDAHQR
jgi:hypothetical protein